MDQYMATTAFQEEIIFGSLTQILTDISTTMRKDRPSQSDRYARTFLKLKKEEKRKLKVTKKTSDPLQSSKVNNQDDKKGNKADNQKNDQVGLYSGIIEPPAFLFREQYLLILIKKKWKQILYQYI